MARLRLSPELRAELRERFGIHKLRPGQGEVIESILDGQDTLAILPTGSGKSLCYQLPSLALAGTTIVVSPLISLMKDQAEKGAQLGINAWEINSTLTSAEEKAAMKEVRRGKPELIFVTPERLTHEKFLQTLQKGEVSLIVIDEAHCLSQWGHDFRPAYLGLGEAIRSLGSPPVLALTATATDEVASDIKVQLGLAEMKTVRTSVHRPNLRMETVLLDKEAEKYPKVLELIRNTEGTGIVYAASIRSVEGLTDFLKAQGIHAERYHAKLKVAERTRVQDGFMAGEYKVVVATQAFGLGIDKPDVRFVIHYQFPGTLEAYYQEAGRAGRDGEPARCVLLYLRKDKSIQSLFLAGKYPDATEISAVYRALGTSGLGLTLSALQSAKPVAKTKVRVILSALVRLRLVKSKKSADGLRYIPVGGGIAPEALDRIAGDYAHKAQKDQEKLKRMISYSQSARCRWRMLMEYFCEAIAPNESNCGHCDRCEVDAQRAAAVA